MRRKHMHRFLISAAHKSSGKTTLSIGIAASLRARGLTVQTFKKGPDYIDPLWLSMASGRGCRNLDFFMSPEEELRDQFAHGSDADICFVEGNKGLYDGLALDGSNSNAALARLFNLPVFLVLDTRGQTRGIAPLILGYQAFDPTVRIAGIILNRLGGSRHETKLRAVIEHYTSVPVIGAVHENDSLAVIERHLGLMPANEAAEAEKTIAEIAAVVQRQVSLDRLLELTTQCKPLKAPANFNTTAQTPIKVAIAKDAAFGFYYADDLQALAAAGAELIPFNTLTDAHLPDCDALLIGGGFPESFLAELEANESLRQDIRNAINSGMPTYAECGGLMYLSESITWQGKTHSMAGVIRGRIEMHSKPVGRGYVIVEATSDHPWCRHANADSSLTLVWSGPILAHEFHYSEIRNLPSDTRYAYTVKRGHGVDGKRDGIVIHNLLASYTHLRNTAGCHWPAQFLRFAQSCNTQKRETVPCSH